MKNILIFNDISGLGNCSMSANLPVFTKYGLYCMPVPTAVYSMQTGFDGFCVLPNVEVGAFAKKALALRSADAVYVGFCNDTATLSAVGDLLADNATKTAYKFVDPIMGDNGKLYPVFDERYVAEMKRIVRRADCISPNLTEACLLADIDYAEFVGSLTCDNVTARCTDVFGDFLRKVGCRSAVITGIECDGVIYNAVLQPCNTTVLGLPKVRGNYSGTGDLFSSVVAAKLLCGTSLPLAVMAAAEFVGTALAATECDDRRFGTEFCRVFDKLE